MVTLVAASVLLSLIGIGYWLSDAAARAVTHRVLALLAAIAFFGVFIDAVDMWFTPTLLLGNLYALFEDGGEMLVMSVAAWYVYLVLAYSAPIPTPRIAQRQPLPHPSR